MLPGEKSPGGLTKLLRRLLKTEKPHFSVISQNLWNTAPPQGDDPRIGGTKFPRARRPVFLAGDGGLDSGSKIKAFGPPRWPPLPASDSEFRKGARQTRGRPDPPPARLTGGRPRAPGLPSLPGLAVPPAHLGHTHRMPTRENGRAGRPGAPEGLGPTARHGKGRPRDPGRPSCSSRRPPPDTRFEQRFQKRNRHFLVPGGVPRALAIPT